MPTKKIKSAGRFGAGYGITLRKKLKKAESKQKKKQACPFCKKLGVKRVARGIWKCPKCKKKFASGIYYIE